MKLLEKKYRDKIDNVICISKHKAKPSRQDCLIFSQRDWNKRLLIRINRLFVRMRYLTKVESDVFVKDIQALDFE